LRSQKPLLGLKSKVSSMAEENKDESSIGRTFQYAFESYQAEDWEKVFNAVSDLMIKSKTASITEKRTLSTPVFYLIAFIFGGVLLLVGLDKLQGDIVVSIGSVIVGYLLSFLGESFTRNE
jgi:hypothetical protein